MKINWTVRLKNKTFWLALIPAVLLLVQAVAAVRVAAHLVKLFIPFIMVCIQNIQMTLVHFVLVQSLIFS